ncbi:uncharacterized protein METZ01_LOCUS469303, partial [marine metagenome]
STPSLEVIFTPLVALVILPLSNIFIFGDSILNISALNIF